MSSNDFYDETLRPQFHFTPKTNWMNDPNGLVFYKGEYHLCFNHNPKGIKWGPSYWGHAVSSDLVHWQHLDLAIEPDEIGWIWTGSAAVDWENTSGFQDNDEKPLVAFYTQGAHQPYIEKPCVQSIAYSNDRGRSWTKYEGNPVAGHIRAQNRDPKVMWHAPSGKWVMALFLDGNDYALLGSENLRQWTRLSDVHMPGTGECPDLFELPVDGDPSDKKWVFWGGAGVYRIGTFDGTTFTPQTHPLWSELGLNGYAAQTWSDIPAEDGRRIQISWMKGGKYPAMPFNQQMSFPVELTLGRFGEGIRLCRKPVEEIERLHTHAHTWENRTLKGAENLIPDTACELFDVRAQIELGSASAFGVSVHGTDLTYDAAEGKLRYLDKEISLPPTDGRLDFQLLVDRTSLEIFGNGGKVSASFCFLPEASEHHLAFYALDGSVGFTSLVVHELRSG